jgi:ABC-type nitrate/sulfonate/bicarbonate transport system substrate-binding protein
MTVRYGQVQRSAMNWPYYIAREEGLFAAAGIEVEEHVYGATGESVEALAAGELDIAHAVPDGDLPAGLRAVARVLDRPSYRLFGRPGRVGVSRPDSGEGLLVQRLLRHIGLPDGHLVMAGPPPERVRALLDGRIDCTMVTEPFAFELEDAGVPLLGELRQAVPDFPFALCIVRGDGPPGLEAWLAALRAARERLHDPAASEVLAAATGCSRETAERVRRYYLREGHLGRFEV